MRRMKIYLWMEQHFALSRIQLPNKWTEEEEVENSKRPAHPSFESRRLAAASCGGKKEEVFPRRPAVPRFILNKRQFHQGHIGCPLSWNSELSALEYRRSWAGVSSGPAVLFKSHPPLELHYASLARFSIFHAPCENDQVTLDSAWPAFLLFSRILLRGKIFYLFNANNVLLYEFGCFRVIVYNNQSKLVSKLLCFIKPEQ